MSLILLKIGGIYHLICALLHVVFPKALNWDDILVLLPNDKRPLVESPLKIMNWALAVIWLIFAYIPFFYSQQLLEPGIGRALLTSIVIFWIIRIFILQPVYMGIKEQVSKRMIGFFLVGLMLFGLPWVLSI